MRQKVVNYTNLRIAPDSPEPVCEETQKSDEIFFLKSGTDTIPKKGPGIGTRPIPRPKPEPKF